MYSYSVKHMYYMYILYLHVLYTYPCIYIPDLYIHTIRQIFIHKGKHTMA